MVRSPARGPAWCAVPAPTVDTDPTTAGTPAPARARLGLAQVTAAAVLFGANASIAKVALESEM